MAFLPPAVLSHTRSRPACGTRDRDHGRCVGRDLRPVLTLVSLKPDRSGAHTAKLPPHTCRHLGRTLPALHWRLVDATLLKDLQPLVGSLTAPQHPMQCRCCHLCRANSDHWGTEGANCLFEVTVLGTVWGQSSGVVTCKTVSFFLHSTAS